MDQLIHPVEGLGELRFAHLTLYDIFGDPKKPEVNGFVPVYRKRLKAELIENLKTSVEAGFIDKEQGLVELCNFDAHHKRSDPLKAFLDFLREAPEALKSVVAHAYGKANDGKELPEVPVEAMHEVFWMLVEPFDIRPAPPESPQTDPASKTATYGDGGESPNPPAPLTYSTTLTETERVSGDSTGIARASA